MNLNIFINYHTKLENACGVEICNLKIVTGCLIYLDDALITSNIKFNALPSYQVKYRISYLYDFFCTTLTNINLIIPDFPEVSNINLYMPRGGVYTRVFLILSYNQTLRKLWQGHPARCFRYSFTKNLHDLKNFRKPIGLINIKDGDDTYRRLYQQMKDVCKTGISITSPLFEEANLLYKTKVKDF